MRSSSRFALIAVSALLLAGCASAEVNLPEVTGGPATPGEPTTPTLEPGLALTECLPGAWKLDNAAQAAAWQANDPTLVSVSGSALVTFGDDTLTLKYNKWTLTADADGEEYIEARTGTNSGHFILAGAQFEPAFDEFAVKLTIEVDGDRSTDEEDVEGIDLLGTLYCYADSLVIENSSAEYTYLIPAK